MIMADFDGVDDLMIDVDSIFDEDSPIAFQCSGGDFTYENLNFDAANRGGFHPQSGLQMSGKSQSLGADFDNVRPEPSLDMNTWFGNSQEGCTLFQGEQGAERVTDPEMPGCSTSFPENGSNYVLGSVDDMRAGTDGEEASYSGWMDCMNQNFNFYNSLVENSLGFSKPRSDVHNVSRDDISSYDEISPKSATGHHSSDYTSELGTHCSNMQFCNSTDDVFITSSPQSFFPPDFPFGFVNTDGVVMTNERDEINEYKTLSACSASGMPAMALNFKTERSDSTATGEISYTGNERFTDDKASVVPFKFSASSFCKNQGIENGSVMQPSVEAINGGMDRKYLGSNNLFVGEDLKQSSLMMLPLPSGYKHEVDTNDEKGNINISIKKAQVDGRVGRFTFEDAGIDLNASNQYSLCTQFSSMSNKQNHYENGRESNLIQSRVLSRVSPESIQSNSSCNRSQVDDDPDICILEDISQPARTNQYQVPNKPIVPIQSSTYGESLHYAGIGAMRYRTNDERVIFQAALQDLSQPKSEASLPDGVLAVPLLRHQRIALWWMIQKETLSVHCSGGILADDQGLGKTVSTIALILKEKPPALLLKAEVVKKEECETLDLDKDDNDLTEVKALKEGTDGGNHSSARSANFFARGRPAGGTLVVCPTSVIRQWADELHKKVTNEANLSVLVYHGSARTKDPYELAKYDVVLTTYAIVSMEVPKQPLVDQDDDGRRKLDSDGVPPLGLLSGNKRKDSSSSGKKGTKNKKAMDASQFEAVAKPLAKVGWFRVVLDEAQSIKNHRTQVARACWGLRAKRRWCLSGTPIQNAIDDLYSYFRFLRYDPYAVYKSFCSTIKIPVQKNPARGYKKLQAVLKTIMLRRTKGTRIDGEPIITLPPKVIQLKRIEFTEEERDFYSRLEADSREQFKEYAAAGTVKQNYVNILLMLLRLRQACDHPLLVRGVDSNSLGKFSFEMAKQLPLEKQQFLLKCLEASLAICGICSDPPEDAVVSICGHVFCNQCISEHLSGDDSKCPIPDCKIRINGPSIFSKATLDSCLSDQVVQEVSSSEHDSPFTTYSEGCPYGSSKIRAALEVLLSLTKQQVGTSTISFIENSSCANAATPESTFGSGGIANSDERKPQIDKKNENSATVVGEKAIVFSQWTRMLDLLEACLKKSSIQYRRLDGTMSVLARDRAVKDFNALPEVSVMIMSLKAASLGLNMVAASRVLLLDLWWNPTTEDQAIDRAHRIGQTRPVTVSRLTVKNTVEDRILALQEKKREMVASAFGEDETGGRQTRLTVEDLEYLFMV